MQVHLTPYVTIGVLYSDFSIVFLVSEQFLRIMLLIPHSMILYLLNLPLYMCRLILQVISTRLSHSSNFSLQMLSVEKWK
jgi:hypothetical protein